MTRIQKEWIARIKDALKSRGFSEGEIDSAIHHVSKGIMASGSRNTSKDLHEFYVEYIRKTGKAILVDDGKSSEWIPISLIEDYDEADFENPGSFVTIRIPEWKAIQVGFL